MHWFQRKKPQLSGRSHFFKNQEKPPKNGNFWKMVILGGFSWFFPEWDFAESWGFLRCNQCIKTLHLSYQTPPYNDFHFSAYNGFLEIFRPLVGGVKNHFDNLENCFLTSPYQGSEKLQKPIISKKMKIIVWGCLIAQMKRFDALITTQKTPALCEVPFWKKSRKIAQNDNFSKITIFFFLFFFLIFLINWTLGFFAL